MASEQDQKKLKLFLFLILSFLAFFSSLVCGGVLFQGKSGDALEVPVTFLPQTFLTDHAMKQQPQCSKSTSLRPLHLNLRVQTNSPSGTVSPGTFSTEVRSVERFSDLRESSRWARIAILYFLELPSQQQHYPGLIPLDISIGRLKLLLLFGLSNIFWGLLQVSDVVSQLQIKYEEH